MKKKALFKAFSIFLVLLTLTACTADIPPHDKTSKDSQLNLIAKNTDIWKPLDIRPGDHYNFAVTDLDNNSRLEVITTVCRGTGQYSESMYYEVDDTFSTLTKWQHITDDYKENLQADIISTKAKCYINPDTNERFFTFGDHRKNGGAYTCHYDMCLTYKNNTVTEEMLAFWEISAATTDEAGNYEITENLRTRNGDILTKEDLQDFADNLFEGFEKYDVSILWQDLCIDKESDTFATDLNESELIKLLAESFDGFNLSPSPTLEELSSAKSQINLLAENKNRWLDSFYAMDYTKAEAFVCVCDLDNNSRLEVITAVTQGSGIGTTSIWAEVLSDYESVLQSQNKTDKLGEPEIIKDTTDCFINPATGERHYTFVNTIRASGDYSTHHQGFLTYKSREVTFNPLATCTSIAENPDDISQRTYTFTDSDGNTITKEEFDNYLDKHFSNCEKHTATFNWQKLPSSSDDISQDELVRILTESYQGFSVK